MLDGTVNDVTAMRVTSTMTVASTLPHFAVMVAFPGAYALTRPFFTVATVSSLLLHSMAAVLAASSGTTVYLIFASSPCSNVILPFDGFTMTISRTSPGPSSDDLLHDASKAAVARTAAALNFEKNLTHS